MYGEYCAYGAEEEDAGGAEPLLPGRKAKLIAAASHVKWAEHRFRYSCALR